MYSGVQAASSSGLSVQMGADGGVSIFNRRAVAGGGTAMRVEWEAIAADGGVLEAGAMDALVPEPSRAVRLEDVLLLRSECFARLTLVGDDDSVLDRKVYWLDGSELPDYGWLGKMRSAKEGRVVVDVEGGRSGGWLFANVSVVAQAIVFMPRVEVWEVDSGQVLPSFVGKLSVLMLAGESNVVSVEVRIGDDLDVEIRVSGWNMEELRFACWYMNVISDGL